MGLVERQKGCKLERRNPEAVLGNRPLATRNSVEFPSPKSQEASRAASAPRPRRGPARRAQRSGRPSAAGPALHGHRASLQKVETR